jgi:hypothetical protein
MPYLIQITNREYSTSASSNGLITSSGKGTERIEGKTHAVVDSGKIEKSELH